MTSQNPARLDAERINKLATLVGLFGDTPDDRMVLLARSDSTTGLREGVTLGDLRALIEIAQGAEAFADALVEGGYIKDTDWPKIAQRVGRAAGGGHA